jgi:F0F1-type ATP synthase assembly protein I
MREFNLTYWFLDHGGSKMVDDPLGSIVSIMIGIIIGIFIICFLETKLTKELDEGKKEGV